MTPLTRKFPLYVGLLREIESIPKPDLSNEEKDLFVKRIKEVDSNCHELTYAIIRCFYLDNKNLKHQYKMMKTGIKYELSLLPPKLARMIFIFVVNMNKN